MELNFESMEWQYGMVSIGPVTVAIHYFAKFLYSFANDRINAAKNQFAFLVLQ